MKNFGTKKILILGMAVAGFMLMGPANHVFAGFGISPADLDNKYMKPAHQYKKEFVISQSDSTEDLKITIEPDLGIVNNWLEFKPAKEFTLQKGVTRFTITIIVNVPQDAELKNYKGPIRVKASSAGENVAGGVSVIKGARLDVDIVTTNIDFADLVVRALEIPTVPGGEMIKLNMKIENKGNVEAAPTAVELNIQDLNQNSISTLTTKDIQKIAAGDTSTVSAYFNNNLQKGDYFGIVKVYLDDTVLREDRLVFAVLEGLPATSNFQANPFAALFQSKLGVNLVCIIGLFILIAFILLFNLKGRMKDKTPEEKKKIIIIFAVLFVALSIAVTLIINL